MVALVCGYKYKNLEKNWQYVHLKDHSECDGNLFISSWHNLELPSSSLEKGLSKSVRDYVDEWEGFYGSLL